MIYIHPHYHIFSSYGSLVIVIKPKSKCRIRTTEMFCVYIVKITEPKNMHKISALYIT